MACFTLPVVTPLKCSKLSGVTGFTLHYCSVTILGNSVVLLLVHFHVCRES